MNKLKVSRMELVKIIPGRNLQRSVDTVYSMMKKDKGTVLYFRMYEGNKEHSDMEGLKIYTRGGKIMMEDNDVGVIEVKELTEILVAWQLSFDLAEETGVDNYSIRVFEG